jgi:hypothetical protein
MRNHIENITSILKQRKYLTISALTFAIFIGIINYFNNLELQLGNLGNFAYLQLVTDVVLAAMFAVFVGLFVFRYDTAKQFNEKKGLFGGSLGVLVFGCAACNITLAGYLGLAGVLSAFPFYGYELKIVALGILLISITKISRLTCRVKL